MDDLGTNTHMLRISGDTGLEFGTPNMLDVDELFRVDKNGNAYIMGGLYLGGYSVTAPDNTLLFCNRSTDPSTPSAGAILWSKSGELWVMDTGGTKTQLSPHDGRGEWVYYSENARTGRRVRIEMERLVRAVEGVTGQQFLFEKLLEVSDETE